MERISRSSAARSYPGRVMVPAAQVQPAQPGQILTERSFKGRKRLHQRGDILLAQGMEMQSFHPVGQLVGQVLSPDAQPAAGGAGVIDGVALLGGMLRVDPQPHAGPAVLPQRAVGFQLRQAVEADMVADLHQFSHFRRGIGRAEHMVLPPRHGFMGQAGLKQTAGGGAGQVPADQRVGIEQRKGFLRQKDVAPRALLHPGQDLQVPAQGLFVHHIDRRLQPGFGAVLPVHHSTVAGASSTTQGRP